MENNWLTIKGYGYNLALKEIEEISLTECSKEAVGEITIPDNVTYIEDGAFEGCSGITSIHIPRSVVKIGGDTGCGAFGGCNNLESIVVDEGNAVFDSRNKCNAIIETATNTLIAGCKNTIIPNDIGGIGECAFRGCTKLISINIPDSVTWIGCSAFLGCTNLASIVIPNNVTKIYEEAFSGCTSLTSVILPDNAVDIDEDAFKNCPALEIQK